MLNKRLTPQFEHDDEGERPLRKKAAKRARCKQQAHSQLASGPSFGSAISRKSPKLSFKGGDDVAPAQVLLATKDTSPDLERDDAQKMSVDEGSKDYEHRPGPFRLATLHWQAGRGAYPSGERRVLSASSTSSARRGGTFGSATSTRAISSASSGSSGGEGSSAMSEAAAASASASSPPMDGRDSSSVAAVGPPTSTAIVSGSCASRTAPLGCGGCDGCGGCGCLAGGVDWPRTIEPAPKEKGRARGSKIPAQHVRNTQDASNVRITHSRSGIP